MDKKQLMEIASDALKGAAFATLIRVTGNLTRGVKVGDQRLVLFTARDK